jgi:hypothetical protein
MSESVEQKEAAATRRRWINFGEIVAVIAVLISALTFWNSYKERNDDAADRAAERADRAREKAEKSHVSHLLLLKAVGTGGTLALSPHDPDQAVQSARILFPAALGVGRIDTLSEPRIESGWVKQALKNAREARKEAKGPGDARMPIVIETRFTSGGDSLSDTAIYDIGYRVAGGGLFGGSEVALRGLSLVARVRPAEAQSRLDAYWRAARAPEGR